MTPTGAFHADSFTARAKGAGVGARGNVVTTRRGDALKRNRDHELYHRSLAHFKNSNSDDGGP
jgi:hypothetical protein